MPTYEFVCQDCDQTVTVTVPMHQLQTPRCLGCQKDMTRSYAIQGVQFKGEGFYSKDKNK